MKKEEIEEAKEDIEIAREKAAEEVAPDLIRKENSLIYNVLKDHYGGNSLLFVSIWNSRSPLHQAESPDVILNLDLTGDKLSVYQYIEDGMCDWSI